MRIVHPELGEIEYGEDHVYGFPEGLLGFEELTKFVLLELEDLDPLYLLISVDDPGVSFPVMSPLGVVVGYTPPLSGADLEPLALNGAEEMALFVIVTIGPEGREVTANLRAPLCLNVRRRLGRQCVLEDGDYDLHHPLMGAPPGVR